MQLKIFLMQQKKLTQNFHKYKKIYYFLIIIISFLFNTYYGYRGIFPIDSFLIFDGGYKILNGYHPFKDYWSITGPLLDYVQYLFFLIFEVNWFSYVLHATVVNTFLAVFIFFFLSKVGLNYLYSFIYTVGVSILAYPSIGTPFMDHHAVIFSIISICFLMIGIKDEKRKYWFFSSIFLVFSFFSKQIPSVYLAVVILFIIVFYFIYLKKKNYELIFYFISGIFTSLALFILIFFINKIPLYNFILQYILYPSSLGNNRIAILNLDFANTIAQFKFIFLSLAPLIFIFFLILRKKINNINQKKDLVNLTLLCTSALIFMYCQLLTKNQVLIFFLVPLYLAISHYYLKNYADNKILISLVLIIFFISTTKYHLRFNHHKKFMELVNVDFNLSVDGGLLDKKFSKLKWITPEYSTQPMEEIKILNDVKNFLIRDQKNKILVTDYQYLPSIINNKFASPNKWYDDLSVPSKQNKYFINYRNFFISNIKNKNIKNIYIIGKSKRKYIEDIFLNPECLEVSDLNIKLLKINLENCEY